MNPLVSALISALISLCAGLIFGIGLIISGMSDPARVQGFLDLAGNWNPSLAFVMAGAIPVAALGFAYVGKRKQTLGGHPAQLPLNRALDARLLIGSLLFGAGWGMAGICPGPALVLLGSGIVKAWGFVAAMLAGMLLFDVLEQRQRHALALAGDA
jgi:uncharacterized membrane protein YedE/YeeE